jgi:CARDB
MVLLHIANSITDLVQGDVQEHLPLERIPLGGDVLGLGTTSGWDNGELTFLCEDLYGQVLAPAAGARGAAPAADPLSQPAGERPSRTRIYKSEPQDGGIRLLQAGQGLSHFPYVCYSDDATSLRRAAPARLQDGVAGRPLQQVIAEAIEAMTAEGSLEPSPIYGVRLLSRWRSLVITVASKLCLGQLRRSEAQARLRSIGAAAATAAPGGGLYERLPHFRLCEQDPQDPADPIRWLGASLTWVCCGFYDTRPELGRLTVPQAGAHLHLHGCSTDLRHGGHLHHEHADTALVALEQLLLYPLQRIEALGSDLAVGDVCYGAGELQFTVRNQGTLDASDIGVAVVIDDRYSDHRYLPLPWLAAGAAERISLPLALSGGPHRLTVIVDPERRILEEESRRGNNSLQLDVIASA